MNFKRPRFCSWLRNVEYTRISIGFNFRATLSRQDFVCRRSARQGRSLETRLESSVSRAIMMARHKQPIHPLLSTVYQLHRLFPLYKFPSLNPKELLSLLHSSAVVEMSGRQTIPSPFKSYEGALTNLLRGGRYPPWCCCREWEHRPWELGKLGKFKQCKW